MNPQKELESFFVWLLDSFMGRLPEATGVLLGAVFVLVVARAIGTL